MTSDDEVHHAGDDAADVDLEDVVGDADPRDPDEASEMLEGLLGDAEAAREATPDDPDEEDAVDEDADSDPHAGETVAGRWTCRFCEQTFRRTSHEDPHHAGCRVSQNHRERLERRDSFEAEHDEAVDADDDRDDHPAPDAGGDTPGEQRTHLIATAWHEFSAYLKYGEHGLDPYFALHSRMRDGDWSDGKITVEFEHDGVPYEAKFSFEPSGLKPWDDDLFQIEKVREYRIEVDGPGELRHASFNLSPRWPNLESKDGYASPSNPRDFVGIDVDASGANIAPETYPKLLDEAASALGVNGGETNRYFAPWNVEPWSRIVDGELYVRIDEEYSGRLIGLQGPLERMSRILVEERDGYRKRVADDTKTAGYYHTTTLGTMRAGRLFDGHRAGKEFKHYHVRDPDAVDDNSPLSEPKFGVSLQNSVTEPVIYWNADALADDPQAADDRLGLEDVERELDTALLNCLHWADLPVRPDHQVFVGDAVFDVTARRRERRIAPDPLPRIEREEEHRVTRALTSMVSPEESESDAQVIGELLADGGHMSPERLADETDYTYRTVLRSLERLEDVVDHSYGEVKLRSQHVAQQLAERAGALLEDFGRLGDRMDSLGDDLAHALDGLGGDTSPFQQWAERYGVTLDDPDDDPRVILRMGYRPADASELDEIVADGITAIRRTLGAEVADGSRLMRWGRIRATLQTGQTVSQQGGTLADAVG